MNTQVYIKSRAISCNATWAADCEVSVRNAQRFFFFFFFSDSMTDLKIGLEERNVLNLIQVLNFLVNCWLFHSLNKKVWHKGNNPVLVRIEAKNVIILGVVLVLHGSVIRPNKPQEKQVLIYVSLGA